MEILKKKIFNFRPLFLVFIALILGIVLSRHILVSNYVYLSIAIFIIFGSLILCLIKKKVKQYLVFLIAFICGFCFYIFEMRLNSPDEIYGERTVVARVSNATSLKSEYQLVVLDSVEIDGEDVDYNIIIYNYSKNNLFTAGDIIIGSVNLKTAKVFNEHFNSTIYKNNVKYTANSNPNNFKVIGQDLKFNEKVQISVKNQLKKFMTEDNSAIAYATLFGDKAEIPIDVRDTFSKSGIAHILAVSGLHVGVLVAFLSFILKKCKVKNYISFILISIILILYCYVCNFSTSVVRATIMAIVLLFMSIVGKKYDSLSAIGLAGILILLFRPLSVFDVGFQMSFACVISIAILAPSIKKLLTKIKIPKFLAFPLAVSISTQIGLIPILADVFGTFSLLSVLLNVIIIPIFSVAFVIQLIFLPLTYLSSFFGNFLYFVRLIYEAIKICASFVSSIPFTFISFSNLNLAIYIGYYSIAIYGSRLALMSGVYKLISCLIILLLTILATGILFVI